MKIKKVKPSQSPLDKLQMSALLQDVMTVYRQHKPVLAPVLEFIDKAVKGKSADIVEQTFSSLILSLRKVDRSLCVALAYYLTEKFPSSSAWLNLAFTHDYFKDHKNSLKAVLKSLEFQTGPELLIKASSLLSKYNQDKLAIDCAKIGYEKSGKSIDLASGVLRVALKNCDWELSQQITHQLQLHYSNPDFKPVETPRTHLLWCADELLNVSVLTKFAVSNFPQRDSDYSYPRRDIVRQKLRIGFISYDYREHATSHLALGLLRHFNTDRFEFFAYCTSWDDGSALRRDILNRFTRVRSLNNKTDKQAADAINADLIDILVDLNGLTEGTKMGVLAYRPSPIQMSYLGFPGTSGGRYIDYFFADDYTVTVQRNSLFPEKIIRIPPTYQINDYEAKWLPPKAVPAKTNLPKNKIVIGMFNNINKVSPEIWGCWMTILNRVTDAVLWILDPGEVARDNLIRASRQHGVAIDKVIFAPKLKLQEHFARLQLCDFVVDPWPYGGHTTTSDALFCAVPVIVLEGKNFASRVSGGLLIAAGLEKLIAKDMSEYIEMAVRLANGKNELKAIKTYLSRNRSRLQVFNAAKRTRQIERAFLFAYDRYLQNQPPACFRVI